MTGRAGDDRALAGLGPRRGRPGQCADRASQAVGANGAARPSAPARSRGPRAPRSARAGQLTGRIPRGRPPAPRSLSRRATATPWARRSIIGVAADAREC